MDRSEILILMDKR